MICCISTLLVYVEKERKEDNKTLRPLSYWNLISKKEVESISSFLFKMVFEVALKYHHQMPTFAGKLCC